ncbi:uroporphyrinogen-III C-methyltransferase [Clostridium sp. HBUAS56010]|uniref:uroporphyrinogen-III C-methyltransferase n=1 Tax=Clostridium sp. HBUAS56010 TaxID=2571127 RepID=UPI001177658F|nr:uroporphyrinogen-III C-methyltransferase [Clostridium sp. HBUAS56010]
MNKTGVVYLVGAGPGDPGLITEKGLLRLKNCDTVVYDSLLSDRLLLEVPDHCEKIYVGKRAGSHSMKQEEINGLLVELAKKGHNVVRLKGGDPFVFGRGGEEVLALAEEGIPYEVVSGVTSAVAALASAGIPVTHRGLSRSFHVMTGHTLSSEGTLPPDFNAFAKLSGTLVFLMGLGNLSLIVKGLIQQGKGKETPAAVIESGTLLEQRVVRGTLLDIEEKVLQSKIKSPAIIVVGEVASLDFSSTFQAPLYGCRVGITGTASFRQRLRKELTSLGAAVWDCLTLSLQTYRKESCMKSIYESLSAYTWIVFTSANGVREFFTGLMEWGRDYRAVGAVKFATVGKGTGDELLKHGFRSDFTPRQYQVKDLAQGLVSRLSKEDRVLIPRSRKGSRELNQIFDQAEVSYDDVILYEVCGDRTHLRQKDGKEKLDYLVFASASGAEAFFEGITWKEMEALKKQRIVCIGDITAAKLNGYGRKADLIAEEYSISGLAEVLCRDYNQSGKSESEEGECDHEV